MAARTRRSIVLHFDLNRTILMSDAVGGRSMENTVNYLLSECTYGYVHPKDAAQWVCVSDASSVEPPATPLVNMDGADVRLPLITYKHFVDVLFPYKSLHDATEENAVEHIKAFNKTAKKQRTALQSAFTDTGPGKRVVGSFNSVMERLHFPQGPTRDAAEALAKKLPASRVKEAWSEGRYYLLPSFVELLSFLESKKDEHDIKLVLRTFGDDLPDVALELELLATGKHPSGKQLPTAFSFDPAGSRIGSFHRDGSGSDGTTLSIRTLRKAPSTSSEPFGTFESGESEEIVSGFSAIAERLRELLQSQSITALRDYWPWWSAHAEASDCGKLLLVDDENETDSSTITMFFDDHIESQDAHIVDVRDIGTGASVPFVKSKDQYLHRVEPFAAIMDPLYFVKVVEGLLGDPRS